MGSRSSLIEGEGISLNPKAEGVVLQPSCRGSHLSFFGCEDAGGWFGCYPLSWVHSKDVVPCKGRSGGYSPESVQFIWFGEDSALRICLVWPLLGALMGCATV